MALNLEDKRVIISKVAEIGKNALSAVIADYRGVCVNQMTSLRRSGRQVDVYMCVVRNTLLHRIIEGSQFECLKNHLVGPILIGYSMRNPGAAARIFKELSKRDSNFKLKAAVFEGKLIIGDEIDSLAAIPTYEEAIGHFALLLKEVSVGRLIRVLVSFQKVVKNV